MQDLGDREPSSEQWSDAEKFAIDFQYKTLAAQTYSNKRKQNAAFYYAHRGLETEAYKRFTSEFRKKISEKKSEEKKETKRILKTTAVVLGFMATGAVLLKNCSDNKSDTTKKTKTEKTIAPTEKTKPTVAIYTP